MKKLFALLLLLPLSATAQTTDQTPILPNPVLTPGATLPVTEADICVPGYAKKARNVRSDQKRKVFADYGIDMTTIVRKDYEVDHLISLELGGSNDTKNLWPEYFKMQYGAHTKDALENKLHEKVCNGELTLEQAQEMIRTDWVKAYKRYFPEH